jgi:hypothetical protein
VTAEEQAEQLAADRIRRASDQLLARLQQHHAKENAPAASQAGRGRKDDNSDRRVSTAAKQ